MTPKEAENMQALKRKAETSDTVMVIRFQMKWSQNQFQGMNCLGKTRYGRIALPLQIQICIMVNGYQMHNRPMFYSAHAPNMILNKSYKDYRGHFKFIIFNPS